MANVNLTIRIDVEDKKRIEEIARENDRSISYVVNQAIKAFLKNSRNSPDHKKN